MLTVVPHWRFVEKEFHEPFSGSLVYQHLKSHTLDLLREKVVGATPQVHFVWVFYDFVHQSLVAVSLISSNGEKLTNQVTLHAGWQIIS
jgi:hypothetical protein